MVFRDPVKGRSWRARIVEDGEGYGVGDRVTHRGRPMVEFFDLSQDEQRFPGGQFVSRYYIDVLPYTGGLNLCGDVPVWTLSGPAMGMVRTWLRNLELGF